MSQASVPIQCGGSGPASALSIFNATLDAPVDTSLTDNKQLVLGTKFMMQVGWAWWRDGWRAVTGIKPAVLLARRKDDIKIQYMQDVIPVCMFPCKLNCRPHSQTSTRVDAGSTIVSCVSSA